MRLQEKCTHPLECFKELFRREQVSRSGDPFMKDLWDCHLPNTEFTEVICSNNVPESSASPLNMSYYSRSNPSQENNDQQPSVLRSALVEKGFKEDYLKEMQAACKEKAQHQLIKKINNEKLQQMQKENEMTARGAPKRRGGNQNKKSPPPKKPKNSPKSKEPVIPRSGTEHVDLGTHPFELPQYQPQGSNCNQINHTNPTRTVPVPIQSPGHAKEQERTNVDLGTTHPVDHRRMIPQHFANGLVNGHPGQPPHHSNPTRTVPVPVDLGNAPMDHMRMILPNFGNGLVNGHPGQPPHHSNPTRTVPVPVDLGAMRQMDHMRMILPNFGNGLVNGHPGQPPHHSNPTRTVPVPVDLGNAPMDHMRMILPNFGNGLVNGHPGQAPHHSNPTRTVPVPVDLGAMRQMDHMRMILQNFGNGLENGHPGQPPHHSNPTRTVPVPVDLGAMRQMDHMRMILQNFGNGLENGHPGQPPHHSNPTRTVPVPVDPGAMHQMDHMRMILPNFGNGLVNGHPGLPPHLFAHMGRPLMPLQLPVNPGIGGNPEQDSANTHVNGRNGVGHIDPTSMLAAASHYPATDNVNGHSGRSNDSNGYRVQLARLTAPPNKQSALEHSSNKVNPVADLTVKNPVDLMVRPSIPQPLPSHNPVIDNPEANAVDLSRRPLPGNNLVYYPAGGNPYDKPATGPRLEKNCEVQVPSRTVPSSQTEDCFQKSNFWNNYPKFSKPVLKTSASEGTVFPISELYEKFNLPSALQIELLTTIETEGCSSQIRSTKPLVQKDAQQQEVSVGCEFSANSPVLQEAQTQESQANEPTFSEKTLNQLEQNTQEVSASQTGTSTNMDSGSEFSINSPFQQDAKAEELEPSVSESADASIETPKETKQEVSVSQAGTSANMNSGSEFSINSPFQQDAKAEELEPSVSESADASIETPEETMQEVSVSQAGTSTNNDRISEEKKKRHAIMLSDCLLTQLYPSPLDVRYAHMNVANSYELIIENNMGAITWLISFITGSTNPRLQLKTFLRKFLNRLDQSSELLRSERTLVITVAAFELILLNIKEALSENFFDLEAVVLDMMRYYLNFRIELAYWKTKKLQGEQLERVLKISTDSIVSTLNFCLAHSPEHIYESLASSELIQRRKICSESVFEHFVENVAKPKTPEEYLRRVLVFRLLGETTESDILEHAMEVIGEGTPAVWRLAGLRQSEYNYEPGLGNISEFLLKHENYRTLHSGYFHKHAFNRRGKR